MGASIQQVSQPQSSNRVDFSFKSVIDFQYSSITISVTVYLNIFHILKMKPSSSFVVKLCLFFVVEGVRDVFAIEIFLNKGWEFRESVSHIVVISM